MPGENPNPAVPAAPVVAPAAPVAAPVVAAAPAVVAKAGETPAAPVLGADPNKPAEPVTPKGAPDAYVFKAPEGQALDAAQIEAFSPLFKELGISQENAQKFVDKSFEVLPKLIEARDTAIQQEIAKEDALKVEATRKDAEYGGDKFEASAKVANAALAKFGRPGLAKKLLEAGLASDPDVVHLLWNVGQKLGESIPPAPGDASAQKPALTSVLYPSMNKH